MAHEFAALPSAAFIGDSIEFPAAHPHGFAYSDDEPAFDASIHLDIRAPPTVTLMDASVVAEWCAPAPFG